jgi:hypothetical protein
MRRLPMSWVCALVLVAATAVPGLRAQVETGGNTAQAPLPQQSPFEPFDRARFEAAARALGADEAAITRLDAAATEVGLARAADDLVRRLSPPLEAAVAAAERGEANAALALAQVVTGASDPLVRAHARYHLSRVFLDSDDPERAVEVLTDYLRQDINRSPLDAEAAYFYAHALAEVPHVDLALPRLRAFLQWFPEASERFRSAAHQRIVELENQQESRLHQLADGMKKTTRDLRKQRTGKPVQIEQERYITELNELIEMFQERESQSSGPASGNGASGTPAAKSALPGGESSVGTLNRRPSLADRWGEMKDRDREKILVEVQNTMPKQYQKMLEDYYKRLGTAGGGQ